MLKSCEKLLETDRSKKVGNHRVEIDNNMRHFFYHWTEICTVDDNKRKFTTQNGGWGTRSTTQAMNSYRYYLTDNGYQEVENLQEIEVANANRRIV